MASKFKLETGKAGTTTANRRILAGVSATSADPTTSAQGYNCQQNDVLHVLFNVGGTNPVFGIQLWWYTAISGQWHKGETLTVQSDDITTVDVNGLERVYVQVTSVAGTTPTLDAWLGLVSQVS